MNPKTAKVSHSNGVADYERQEFMLVFYSTLCGEDDNSYYRESEDSDFSAGGVTRVSVGGASLPVAASASSVAGA